MLNLETYCYEHITKTTDPADAAERVQPEDYQVLRQYHRPNRIVLPHSGRSTID